LQGESLLGSYRINQAGDHIHIDSLPHLSIKGRVGAQNSNVRVKCANELRPIFSTTRFVFFPHLGLTFLEKSNFLEGRIMQAIWNGVVLAESDNTVVVEGNHYFPAEAINKEYFQTSDTHTTCPWKGEASYYNVIVNGEVNQDAAWYYPETKEAADNIKNHVAFWKGVKVE
jgi:uncharacterized protein (DUF427 family)